MSEAPHQHFPGDATPPDPREARLQEIRREAESKLAATSVRARARESEAADFLEAGYYGKPLLKKPSWKPEIPIYFFAGGAAGAAAIMAGVANFTGADPRLTRDARYLAAIGGAISPVLLISDLGVPSRFVNMLRVFKIQSPMSVGSWTLVAFSSSAAAAAFLGAMRERSRLAFAPIRMIESASHFVSAITGAVLSTYTGVLIGATAIPVWNENAKLLPIHFATSGMSAAASILELRGHNVAALNAIGIAGAVGETLVGASIEFRSSRALKPLKSGWSGWLTRLGGLLSGPLPLVLRLLSLGGNSRRRQNLRKMAAASTVAGSLVTRFAWTQAGEASSKDPTIPLQSKTAGTDHTKLT
jgi:hypothetical protein